ncbi:MAG: hypothetical protein CVU84_05880 [Firmicutes bacterium HGW-Firmicutes-1]|jgi:hypothetical protein|nr:MAG: hypothetical protein CVU84_05880 [Firmicutes bacterium HGW-Firmicutes-1]
MNKPKSTKNTRKLKEKRKALGLCIDCSRPHQTGFLRCHDCLEIQAEYARRKRKGEQIDK